LRALFAFAARADHSKSVTVPFFSSALAWPVRRCLIRHRRARVDHRPSPPGRRRALIPTHHRCGFGTPGAVSRRPALPLPLDPCRRPFDPAGRAPPIQNRRGFRPGRVLLGSTRSQGLRVLLASDKVGHAACAE